MKFVLTELLRLIRRTPGHASLMLVAVALAAALSLVAGWLYHRSLVSLDTLKSEVRIEAFFDAAVADSAARQFANSVRKLPEVRSVTVITKEEALDVYRKSTGEDAAAILGFNPLPASLLITLAVPSLQNEQSLATKLGSVLTVRFDKRSILELEDQTASVRSLAIILGGFILTLAFLFLFTSSRAIQVRRASATRTRMLLGVNTMKLALPFVLEAALAGMFGGLIGCAGFLILLRSSLPYVSEAFAPTRPFASIATTLGWITPTLALIASAALAMVAFTWQVRLERRRFA